MRGFHSEVEIAAKPMGGDRHSGRCESRSAEARGPALDVASSLLRTLERLCALEEVSPGDMAGDARRASLQKGDAILDAYASALAARLRASEPWT